MAREGHIIVGLDIGTTKTCALVASIDQDGHGEIIGVGSQPSRGLQKGMISNIDQTVDSIRRAVEEAERMAGVKIDSVYTGIAGSHIKGINSPGIVAVRNREVSPSDINRAIESAQAVAVPSGQRILDVIPQEFVVDSQGGIKDPLGMSCVRLEAIVHIITGSVMAVENIEKCIHRAELKMIQLFLQPLASSEAVLTPEEQELGVAVADIGGGTTDLAIFSEGYIRHTAVIAIGGNHFTNDIAVGLCTPHAEAEKIKLKYGAAQADRVKDEMIEVTSVGWRPPRLLSRQALAEIIQPRAEELCMLIAEEIKKVGSHDAVASGLVVTGGTAALSGIIETAERVLGLPVRRGYPTGFGGLIDIVRGPAYATGVGLILCAMQKAQPQIPPGWFSQIKHHLSEWKDKVF